MRLFRVNILSDKALADIIQSKSKVSTVRLVLDGKTLGDTLLGLKRETGEA